MSPGFHLVDFVFGVNHENQEAGESNIPLRNPSDGKLLLRTSSNYNKLLGIVAFSTRKLYRNCSTGL